MLNAATERLESARAQGEEHMSSFDAALVSVLERRAVRPPHHGKQNEWRTLLDGHLNNMSKRLNDYFKVLHASVQHNSPVLMVSLCSAFRLRCRAQISYNEGG